ncbi:hypothetical protein O0I10_000589 [Lichtheimia ornata]|uniref:Small acidic protein n=1 Tax=Lichtheimia ornata TaxID=688661 RepID=A0AAD7Y3Z9_9FUNG|nr:uncharacterized protein O0I10_000589 [Lichtheimia ornata]KAJ8663350.1 hypothetical protein O0I10_000589 [Lichtheimia ornata]
MGSSDKVKEKEKHATDLAKKKSKKEKSSDDKKRKREDSVEKKAKKSKSNGDDGVKKEKKKKEKKKKDKTKGDDEKKQRKHACDSNPSTPENIDTQPSSPSNTNNEDAKEESGGWNNWNKASFGGDQQQKDKFLRLLGAKKASNQPSERQQTKKSGGGLYGSLKSAIDEDEKHRISNDLQKQFEDGLRFRKQQQMGRRGGLGS